MTGVRTRFLAFLVLAGLTVVGIVSVVGNPFAGSASNPGTIATRSGAPGVRQPKPTTSDGTYLYVTVSWEQGATAAVSVTASGEPILPPQWIAEGGGRVSYCDVVCATSPSKFSIQVRRGDRVIVSVVATARWGRVFCSLRRVGEGDAQLVKPAKNTGLEGQVVCGQTAR